MKKRMRKTEIRKNYAAKYGRKLSKGRMQISAHGAGNYSIQIFRFGKLVNDVDVNEKIIWSEPCASIAEAKKISAARKTELAAK